LANVQDDDKSRILEQWLAAFKRGDKYHGDNQFAAPWMSDKASKKCMRCGAKFTLLRRRHHCRLCGDLLCDKCSSRRIKSLGEEASSVEIRACDRCAEDYEREKEFVDGDDHSGDDGRSDEDGRSEG
jgi:hypothetical protein